MYTTLRQWGNSVGVSIPREALDSCSLQLNDELVSAVNSFKPKTAI